MKKYSFSKEERLCKKSILDVLFHEGSSFILYPYRVVFLTYPQDLSLETGKSCPQVMISVPKKRFKTAVARNVLKRRIRECYRLQKEEFLYVPLEIQQLNLYFAIQYIGKEIESYTFMYERMQKMLKRLLQEIAKANS